MLYGIVERKRGIKMRSTFRKVPRRQQRRPHDAMPNHQRNCRPLPLGQRQDVGSEIATDIAVERDVVCDPDAIEDRVQQQWVFEGLSERLCLFYE